MFIVAERATDREAGAVHLSFYLDWLETNTEDAKREGRHSGVLKLVWMAVDVETRILLHGKGLALSHQYPKPNAVSDVCGRLACLAEHARTLGSHRLETFFKFCERVCAMYAGMTEHQRERMRQITCTTRTRITDQEVCSKAKRLVLELDAGNVDKCVKSVLLILCSDWICGGSIIEKAAILTKLCAHMYNRIRGNHHNYNSEH